MSQRRITGKLECCPVNCLDNAFTIMASTITSSTYDQKFDYLTRNMRHPPKTSNKNKAINNHR
jgi:hypothetical protein